MITTNLYNQVLFNPAKAGANKLLIISGYATSAMAFRHLDELKNEGLNVTVKLIVGMCVQDGLSLSNHKGFQKIACEEFPESFQCSYLYKRPPVHSKVYLWLKDSQPVVAFAGSANYSQFAFSKFQREILTSTDPLAVFDYFKDISADSIYCENLEVEDLISIYSDEQYRQRFTAQPDEEKDDATTLKREDDLGGSVLNQVTVSLLDRHGEVPKGASGLNWGLRPDDHRKDVNAAYIQLPPSVYRSDFFPVRGTEFTILTDDGKSLHCERKSKDTDGQQIVTPRRNQSLGEYFRKRLGVKSGERIVTADLKRYGRTDVVFRKIDDETFEMDFSV